MTQRNTQEVNDKDLTAEERREAPKGKQKEWDKLLKTGAIKMYDGEDAEMVFQEHPKERILDSRFVKTRREDPDEPGRTEIKYRWCIQGYKDPDVYEVERQSPTLSMDALMICLQLLASKKWRMIISDVEGAFLQGEKLDRKRGKIFVRLPKDGVPGYSKKAVAEIVKCVYGLCDAPRSWWLSFLKP